MQLYVANASTDPVSFDNLTIVRIQGMLRATKDYYPYGMELDGINPTSDGYAYGYSGKELQENEYTALGGSYYGGGITGLDENDLEARFYDPAIGRWSNPDPAEQFANPYMAMGDNPTNHTDPNGQLLVEMALGAVMGVISNGIQNTQNGNPFFQGAIKQGIMGAISGGISNEIGTHLSNDLIAQTAAHGVLGGFENLAMGGNFGTGFTSGAFSSAFASGTPAAYGAGGLMQFAETTIGGGLVGGLASQAQGGSFMNGFEIGAISAGANHAAHAYESERFWKKMASEACFVSSRKEMINELLHSSVETHGVDVHDGNIEKHLILYDNSATSIASHFSRMSLPKQYRDYLIRMFHNHPKNGVVSWYDSQTAAEMDVPSYVITNTIIYMVNPYFLPPRNGQLPVPEDSVPKTAGLDIYGHKIANTSDWLQGNWGPEFK